MSVASHSQIAETLPISSESRHRPLNPSFSPHAGRRSRERRRESKRRTLSFSRRTRARGLPTKATNSFASKKKKGGGAPKRRNCPVGPRHASDVATSIRFGRGRAFSGTRSPFGAPPRFLLRPYAETQSGPRFTRCSAPRLSEAPRAPVVMPAGSMPGPPESGSDEPPPAGTAPAPSVGVTG